MKNHGRVRAWTLAAVCFVLTGAMPIASSLDEGRERDISFASLVEADPVDPTDVTAPIDSGAWGPVLDWGQQAKHMVTLSTGKVLVWSTGDNARVWDPATGIFTLTPATFGDLHCAGQSTLADGRVIVVGGQNGPPHDGTNITALFDPVTETWTQGATMTDLRWYATSTTLADGRVLATSGDAPDGSRSTVPEVYDPATDTWTRLTGAARNQGLYPFMFVRPDGRVYEAGATAATATLDVAGVGSWTAGPIAPWSTNGYSESAVMYEPGKVMRAGGGEPAQARTAVIDLTAANPMWRETSPMAFARRRMNLTILADGSVMAIGGTASGDSALTAVLAGEIWDPATETWTTVADMTEPRMYHSSAVLLPDGRIVVGGGEATGRLRAQVYSPPYLFKGDRPVIASAPTSAAYGTTFAIQSPDAGAVASVALIRPSAATHALDMNQRFVPLAYTRSGTTLQVSSPSSGGVAPPGEYMLVIKDGAGVPSIASWLRVGTAGTLAPGRISGRVSAADTDASVAGATVATKTTSQITDADGRYTLTDVLAGEAVVTVSATGYASVSRTVAVSGGATSTLDVSLVPPGSVFGTVTDEGTGLPLPGATIAYPGGTTTSDAVGSYWIDGIASGSTSLSISALGFVGTTRTVDVPANGLATVDVALTPNVTYVVGEVRDAATQTPIAGAAISVANGPTTTTDAQGRYRIDLPPGSYSVTASAIGYQPAGGAAVINGGSYATLDLALTRAPAADSLAFTAMAVAHVKSTSPANNYGTGSTIRIRAGTSSTDPSYIGFLRFEVSGLAGRAVTGASLRLFITDGGPSGGILFRTSTGWTETGITWVNAPARSGTSLAAIGSVADGSWVSVPIPPTAVAGDGAIAFRLEGGNTNSVYLSSRRGANPPRLELTLGSTPTPTPAPTPTPTPTLKDITFEGGLLHPQTGVDSVSGPVILETSNPIGGTSSARVAGTAAYLQESFAATADLFVRMRIRIPAVNTASPRILQLSINGTTTANLVLLPDGRLRLRVGSTTIGSDSAPLQVGTTYAIGVHLRRGTGSNGLVEGFVGADGAPFSSPFASRSNGSWTTSTDRIRFGATNVTANLVVDDVRLAAGSMPTAAFPAANAILAVAIVGTAGSIAGPASATTDASLRGRQFLCPI